MNTPTHHQFLDTSGLLCPLPVLKTRKALANISPGHTLLVRVTDPGAPQDITMLAKKIHANILNISHEPSQNHWDILISSQPQT